MGHAGRDHGLPALARDREEPEAPHRAPLATTTVMVMEPLIELILVIAGLIVTAALLPLRTKARVVVGFCGLVLVAVGGVLFAFVAYPSETVLFLSASAAIAGTAWGYTRVTAWLTRRATAPHGGERTCWQPSLAELLAKPPNA
jgi:hypothetical protein